MWRFEEIKYYLLLYFYFNLSVNRITKGYEWFGTKFGSRIGLSPRISGSISRD